MLNILFLGVCLRDNFSYMLKIEQLKEKDLAGLMALYEEAFETSTNELEPVKKTFFNKIKNNPDYCIHCAKDNNRLIGSVMGVVCYELFGSCKPFMVVENVAVLDEYRRKGIAKMLMLELEKIARDKACSMILFVSSEHRKGAHKLYESLGYGVDKVNGYRKRL